MTYEPPYEQPQASDVTVGFDIVNTPIIKWKLDKGKISDVRFFVVKRIHNGKMEKCVGSLDPESSSSTDVFSKKDPWVGSLVGQIGYSVITVAHDGKIHTTPVTSNSTITKKMDIDSSLLSSKEGSNVYSSAGTEKISLPSSTPAASQGQGPFGGYTP